MKNLYIVCFLVLTICFTQTSQAQFLDKKKKTTEQKIKKEGEKRVQDKINKGVDKTYDTAEDQLKGNSDTKKDGEKKADDKTNKAADKNVPQTDQQFVVNSKYDFMPGEKVLFYDDFTAENIGDFPIQWNTTGSGEVVTVSGSD